MKETFLFILFSSIVFITACGQEEQVNKSDITETQEKENATAKKHRAPHPYGGWYCPDNFGGFPPMDIRDVDKLAVISDRLPTKEEASDGRALIYIDTTQVKNVKALDINLPRVGRIHSSNSDIDELIIVIQALVMDQDTIVGYRFPNGGNGSGWLEDVSFLSDEELAEIGSTDFVYLNSDLSATKKEIWKAFTSTSYAKNLAEKFDQKPFFSSEWTDYSTVYLNYKSDTEYATGVITTHFGNFYLHIDYMLDGFHYSEKLLLMEDTENNTTNLQMAAGPYPKDFESQKNMWEYWLREVTEGSEEK